MKLKNKTSKNKQKKDKKITIENIEIQNFKTNDIILNHILLYPRISQNPHYLFANYRYPISSTISYQ